MTTAILDLRPAAAPGVVRRKGAPPTLGQLFGLNRLPAAERPLACHWRRDASGRLFCVWEPD